MTARPDNGRRVDLWPTPSAYASDALDREPPAAVLDRWRTWWPHYSAIAVSDPHGRARTYRLPPRSETREA